MIDDSSDLGSWSRAMARGCVPAAVDFGDDRPRDRDANGLGGGIKEGGVHAEYVRRDRVRRHPEAPATFPAGDVA